MSLPSKVGTLKGTWSFAVNGGVQGVYDLGMILPKNAFPLALIVTTLIAPASLGMATLTFGEVSTDNSPGTTVANAYGGSNFSIAIFNNPDYHQLPYSHADIRTHTRELIMTIGVADLTDGSLLFSLTYSTSQF